MQEKFNKLKDQHKKKYKIVLLLLPILILLGLFSFFAYKYISEKSSEVSNIRITNVTGTSVTVSWMTKDPVKGSILYSKDNKWFPVLGYIGKERAYDDRDIEEVEYGEYELNEWGEYYMHHVTLRGLDSSSKYFYRISTGIKNVISDYPALETRSVQEEISTPYPVYGRVYSAKDELAGDTIIYLYFQKDEKKSQVLSTVVTKGEGWSLDVSNIRTENKESMFDRSSSNIFIDIRANKVDMSGLEVDAAKLQPVDDIYLWQYITDEDLVGEVKSLRSLVYPAYAGGDCTGYENAGKACNRDSCELFECDTSKSPPEWKGPVGSCGDSCKGNPCWEEKCAGESGDTGGDEPPEQEDTPPTEDQGDDTGGESDCSDIYDKDLSGYDCDSGNLLDPNGNKASLQKWCGSGCPAYVSNPSCCSGQDVCRCAGSGDSSSPPSPPAEEEEEEVVVQEEDLDDDDGDDEEEEPTIPRPIPPEEEEEEEKCNSYFYSYNENLPDSCNDLPECPKGRYCSYYKLDGATVSQCISFGEEGISIYTNCCDEGIEVDEDENRCMVEREEIGEDSNRPDACPPGYGDSPYEDTEGDLQYVYCTKDAERRNNYQCVRPKKVWKDGNWISAYEETADCNADGECVNEGNDGVKCSMGSNDSGASCYCNKNSIDAVKLHYFPNPGMYFECNTSEIREALNREKYRITCTGEESDFRQNKWLVEEVEDDTINIAITHEQEETFILRDENNRRFGSRNVISGVKANDGSVVNTIQRSGVYEIQGATLSSGKSELKLVVEEGEELKFNFYTDSNRNGIRDEGEELVYSDDIKLVMKEDIVNYSFDMGWKLVSFPLVSDRIKTAKSLLNAINNSEGYATHVATYRNGKWQIYSQRADKSFSEDFDLFPGVGYFIRVHQATNITVAGNKLAESMPLELETGWNLVGIYSPDTDYTANSLLISIENGGFEADTMTKWDNGKYYDYIRSEGLSYGNDFKIFETGGYFIRVKGSGGTYTP